MPHFNIFYLKCKNHYGVCVLPIQTVPENTMHGGQFKRLNCQSSGLISQKIGALSPEYKTECHCASYEK